MKKEDIYPLALQAGFTLSTQYGQAENKLMPISDGETLLKFAQLIIKELKTCPPCNGDCRQGRDCPARK